MNASSLVKKPESKVILHQYQKKNGSFLTYFIEKNCCELVPFSGKYILYSHNGMN